MRYQRINELARLAGAKRYLEVGVAFGETFFEVGIPFKVAVDPQFRFDVASKANKRTHFHPLPSDAFFASAGTDPFDIIYLDGLHTFEQTTRDFFNSLRLSHARTIWLIDDTVPNDADSALPDQAECYHRRAVAGNPDPSWMGDVYKMIFLIERTMPFFHFRTFEGHGQTVLWQSKMARPVSADGPILDAVGSIDYDGFLKHLDVMRLESDADIYAAVRSGLGLKPRV